LTATPETRTTVEGEQREDGRGKMEDGSNCHDLWGRREKTVDRRENKRTVIRKGRWEMEAKDRRG